MIGTRTRPVVSIVLATHNRRAAVENTLDRLDECGLDRGDYETIVVDNASADGTAESVAHRVNRILPLQRNAGSTAKAFGADVARGRYLLFLDDDSYPCPGSVERMIERFDADSSLAAAGFTVHLPSGRLEGSALPGVFVGCGVGLRTDAYRAVGGLDRSFFMQAEEYDLCFRLAAADWRVGVFDDLHVDHLKTDQARRSERTAYFDIRNNLRVIARYLPRPYSHWYRKDCVLRYRWLAEREGEAHRAAFRRGRRSGAILSNWDRVTHSNRRLSRTAFDRFFGWSKIEQGMRGLAADGIRRIVLADFGKNIHPFVRFAQESGLEILAIADERFAATGRRYRGIPVLPVDDALAGGGDIVIVSNCGPVHAAQTTALLMLKTRMPVDSWFSAPPDSTRDDGDLFDRGLRSDENRVAPSFAFAHG